MSAGGPPGPVAILRDLLRFDTTNPPGREAPLVDRVEELLRGAGLDTRRLASDPERPNLWARLPGRGEAPPLLLYGHADVVPADPARWSRPPFGGQVADGQVWGRGALDMKGGLAMMISALLRAADGPPPAGDVILLVLADEEGTSEAGARFLTREHPELFEDVRYAVGELGGFPLDLGGDRFYAVQVAAKRLCWLEARIPAADDDRGGHGALSSGNSAVTRLGRFLTAVGEARLPYRLTPPVERMIRAMIEGAGDDTAAVLAGLLDAGTADRSLERLPAHRPLFDALLRDTANPTVVRAGDKINVVPDRATVRIDGRLLPGGDAAELVASIRRVLPEDLRDVPIEPVRNPSGQGEPDLGLFPLLRDLTLEADPAGTPIPFVLPAVTDAHYLAELGVQSYGFLPMDLPRGFDLLERIHAPDERVPAGSIEFGARVLHRMIRRYGGAA